MISSTGDNMANIEQMKKKSIGVIKKILNKLNSSNLQTYYFECSIILLNVILRPSILYACEAYYNLKENELRQIERIEENYLRKVLNTTKGCPIVQLYLETGHIPARLEIQKTRLLYLQYILQQTEESTIFKFFNLQLESPTRGDWASTCIEDMKYLNIELSLAEIRCMSKCQFTKILKAKMKTSAIKYLKGKQGFKGQDIEYSCNEMSEYLLPINKNLTIDEKRRLFGVRNKMTDIPSNFSRGEKEMKCQCNQKEDMKHIYECEIYNEEKFELPYEKIYNGNINEQIAVFKKFEQNLQKREQLRTKNDLPCDPNVIRCNRSIG